MTEPIVLISSDDEEDELEISTSKKKVGDSLQPSSSNNSPSGSKNKIQKSRHQLNESLQNFRNYLNSPKAKSTKKSSENPSKEKPNRIESFISKIKSNGNLEKVKLTSSPNREKIDSKDLKKREKLKKPAKKNNEVIAKRQGSFRLSNVVVKPRIETNQVVSAPVFNEKVLIIDSKDNDAFENDEKSANEVLTQNDVAFALLGIGLDDEEKNYEDNVSNGLSNKQSTSKPNDETKQTENDINVEEKQQILDPNESCDDTLKDVSDECEKKNKPTEISILPSTSNKNNISNSLITKDRENLTEVSNKLEETNEDTGSSDSISKSSNIQGVTDKTKDTSNSKIQLKHLSDNKSKEHNMSERSLNAASKAKEHFTSKTDSKITDAGINESELQKVAKEPNITTKKIVQNVITIDDDDDTSSSTKPDNDSQVSSQKFLTKKQIRKLKIRKMERKLEAMENAINRYATLELTMNDMEREESAYIREAKVKENFIQLWRKYCKLIGDDPDKHISSRKKIRVTSSPFHELNRAVEKFINKRDIFPNLFEVRNKCIEANDKHELNIKLIDIEQCAVQIFSEVGTKLQKNRERELRKFGGNSLTDKVKLEEDPAHHDSELKRQLKQNRKIAKSRSDKVFENFSRLQDLQKSDHLPDEISHSDDEEDEYDETLQKLHENYLIENDSVNRDYVKTTNGKEKKKMKEETVISVTLSSSKENTPKEIDVKIKTPSKRKSLTRELKEPRVMVSPLPITKSIVSNKHSLNTPGKHYSPNSANIEKGFERSEKRIFKTPSLLKEKILTNSDRSRNVCGTSQQSSPSTGNAEKGLEIHKNTSFEKSNNGMKRHILEKPYLSFESKNNDSSTYHSPLKRFKTLSGKSVSLSSQLHDKLYPYKSSCTLTKPSPNPNKESEQLQNVNNNDKKKINNTLKSKLSPNTKSSDIIMISDDED